MGHIAIIPARGGSKRIPRKNVRPFLGQPMIAHPIALALECGLFDDVVVSTDDVEIAEIAEQSGARVPFLRPAELSDDFAGTRPVIDHALDQLLATGRAIASACCIYPCTPLLRTNDLIAARDLLDASATDRFVFPVVEFPSPIERALRRDDAGHVSPASPTHTQTRTQDLPSAYYDAGQFYWGRLAAWQGRREVFDGASTLVLDATRVVDIDTEADWAMAERLARITV